MWTKKVKETCWFLVLGLAVFSGASIAEPNTPASVLFCARALAEVSSRFADYDVKVRVSLDGNQRGQTLRALFSAAFGGGKGAFMERLGIKLSLREAGKWEDVIPALDFYPHGREYVDYLKPVEKQARIDEAEAKLEKWIGEVEERLNGSVPLVLETYVAGSDFNKREKIRFARLPDGTWDVEIYNFGPEAYETAVAVRRQLHEALPSAVFVFPARERSGN